MVAEERGGIVSVWNCAHNVAAGSRRCTISCWGWRGLTTGKRRSYASLWRDCGGAVRFRNDARYAAILRSTAYRRYKTTIRTTTTKKAEEELTETNLHAVRTAKQTVVVHRYRQRVLFYLLRYGILDWSRPT